MPLKIGQSTTQPLDVILKLNGEFIDLTGATVTFSLVDFRYLEGSQAGAITLKVDAAACTLPNSSGADGTVRWSPSLTDTDTHGKYRYQYKVTYATGKIERFPKDFRDDYLDVEPSIDDLV